MRKEKQQHLPFVTPPIAPVAARAPVEDAAALKARGSLTHGRQEVRAPQNCEIKEWRDAKDRFVKYNLHVIFRNTKFEYARSFAKSYFGLYVLYVRTASSRSLARPPRSDPCSVRPCVAPSRSAPPPASQHPPPSPCSRRGGETTPGGLAPSGPTGQQMFTPLRFKVSGR